MKSMKPFTFRQVRAQKHWAYVTTIAMLMSSISGLIVPAVVNAQSQVAPVSQGFLIDAEDLRFIFHQIEVGQAHAAGGQLLGPGANQVSSFGTADPQLPIGLRTVDGSFNNLVPGQSKFGASDQNFPRLVSPTYRSAETL